MRHQGWADSQRETVGGVTGAGGGEVGLTAQWLLGFCLQATVWWAQTMMTMAHPSAVYPTLAKRAHFMIFETHITTTEKHSYSISGEKTVLRKCEDGNIRIL